MKRLITTLLAAVMVISLLACGVGTAAADDATVTIQASDVDLQLTHKARVVILGDWISHFSYVVFDGEHFLTQQYIEGESQP